MSIVIDKVMTIFGAMDKEEKTELIRRIIEDNDVKSIVAETNAKNEDSAKNVRGSKTPKTKRKGGWKKGGKSPFYIKSITGVDDTKKGMFRAIGDFTNDYEGDLGVGEYVIIHQRDPRDEDDAYILAMRQDCPSGSSKIEMYSSTSGATTVTLQGLTYIYNNVKANKVIDYYRDHCAKSMF